MNYHYPQRIYKWFLDLLFPVKCLGCGKFGQYVCRGCLGTIAVKKTFECIGCKRNTPFGQTCYLCANRVPRRAKAPPGNHSEQTNSVDQLLIAADYKEPLVERSLKFLKYKFITDLSGPLSVLVKRYLKWLSLNKKLNVFEDNPLLVPVPLHQRRLNWRGFNQSQLLAKNISDAFQMEMAEGVIVRPINTLPQADIKERKERMKNLNGIFSVVDKNKVNGRKIILVDDVCTTGATLNECARVLKNNGATKVIGLVVARG